MDAVSKRVGNHLELVVGTGKGAVSPALYVIKDHANFLKIEIMPYDLPPLIDALISEHTLLQELAQKQGAADRVVNALGRIPEEMTVAQLNQAVRDLREQMYQKQIQIQALQRDLRYAEEHEFKFVADPNGGHMLSPTGDKWYPEGHQS